MSCCVASLGQMWQKPACKGCWCRIGGLLREQRSIIRDRFCRAKEQQDQYRFPHTPMTDNEFSWEGRTYGNLKHDLIAAYLAIDIQKSRYGAEELLQKTREVRSGRIFSWERIGNAYWLRLFPDHVEIAEDYGEKVGEAARIPISDFEAAVAAWRDYANP